MANNWWQVALVGGIALGALVSARLSGAKREPISPIWARALGSDAPGRRYAVAFAAGFLMLFGARIADGCTSGHGLSGIAQLAVGSTVAVAAMFARGVFPPGPGAAPDLPHPPGNGAPVAPNENTPT